MKNDRLQLGIIGAGVMGKRRAEIANTDPSAAVIAVADVDLERAATIAKQSGTPDCISTTQWQDVVNNEQIDAVIVGTFNDMLAPISIAALKAGKQVLCEKPLGRSLSDAQQMVAAAQETGHILQIGFNHRHHPALKRAHALFTEGAIGDIMYIRAFYGHGGRPDYDKGWRFTSEISGGGQLMDQGVHALDLVHWFMGEFSQLFARKQTFYWPVQPLEDNAFIVMWREDGKTAQLHTTITQWRNRFEFEIFGRDGYLSVQGLGKSYGTEKLTLGKRHPQGGVPEETVWEFPGDDISWQAEWDDFMAAIKTGRTPLCTVQSGLHSMELIDAAYRSAASGGVVAVK